MSLLALHRGWKYTSSTYIFLYKRQKWALNSFILFFRVFSLLMVLQIVSSSKFVTTYCARELFHLLVNDINVVRKAPFITVCLSTFLTSVTLQTTVVMNPHVPLHSKCRRELLSTQVTNPFLTFTLFTQNFFLFKTQRAIAGFCMMSHFILRTLVRLRSILPKWGINKLPDYLSFSR